MKVQQLNIRIAKGFPTFDHAAGLREVTIISETMRRSLWLLLKAHKYARSVEHSTWDFAIEIQRLRDAGLSECDLRWFMCMHYVEHALEITLPNQPGRSFRSLETLKFQDDSCFVLTDEGLSFAEHVGRLPWECLSFGKTGSDQLTTSRGSETVAVPCWNALHLELRVGNDVVKRYRAPAPNQEAVLAAFEEEDWPERIDDPLSPATEIDPKRRLHSTIQCLNRNQRHRLIHFRGDGHGTGICWELVD